MTDEVMHSVRNVRNGTTTHTPVISVQGEVSIVLHFQLRSTYYTVVKINNCLNRPSAIRVVTMKIQTISIMKGSYHQGRVWKVGLHFVQKAEDQKRKKGKQVPWRVKEVVIAIAIIPIYSFTGKLHCLMNTSTTDCSIAVS